MDYFKINGEFGYELAMFIPMVYDHYLKGNKVSITSHKDTACFYHFADEFTESNEIRKAWMEVNKNGTLYFDNNIVSLCFHIPPSVDASIRSIPPYKSLYKNNKFVFEKPICLISNKFNEEWGGGPINYIDLNTLGSLFDLLKDDYQIIYNRPNIFNIVGDDSRIHVLGDYDFIRFKYGSKVILIQDLLTKDISYNNLQMMLFANTDKFISVQGGTSVLSSYFGGTNIVYAKTGPELEGAYDTWYRDLSGCDIKVVSNNEDLISKVKEELVCKK